MCFSVQVCVCLRPAVISGTPERAYQDILVPGTLKMPTNSGSPVSGWRLRYPRWPEMGLFAALLQLDLPVGRMFMRAACSVGLGRPERGVALNGHAVCVLDSAQAGGYPGFAGGDGLAVAAAVGAFGQGLAVALDFADVGFAFVGVGGDGEHDGVGRGGVEDEGHGLGFGVAAGQGNGSGLVDLRQRRLGGCSAVPGSVVEAFEHCVGAVELVAGGGEVLADRAEVGAAGDAVLQETADFGPVGVDAGAGVDAQLGLERVADGAGLDEADQALGEGRGLGAGGQPDRQPPGGEVVDGAALGVGGGDAVVNEPFVQG